MNKSNGFSPEVRERAVRLVQGHRGQYPSLWAGVEAIAPKIGCVPQTRLEWVKRVEIDGGRRDGLTTTERERIKELECKNMELRRAKETLRTASAFFRAGGVRPQTQVVNAYIDQYRTTYGVEPICNMLQVAPFAYRRRAAPQRGPELRTARAKRDEMLVPHIRRV